MSVSLKTCSADRSVILTPQNQTRRKKSRYGINGDNLSQSTRSENRLFQNLDLKSVKPLHHQMLPIRWLQEINLQEKFQKKGLSKWSFVGDFCRFKFNQSLLWMTHKACFSNFVSIAYQVLRVRFSNRWRLYNKLTREGVLWCSRPFYSLKSLVEIWK